MEFKSLKNIETSFRQIRLFGIVFVCLCAGITGYSVWSAYTFAEKQRQRIYVLDGGRSLILALSQDLAQNRPVEAKEHVRRFHELFFTLSPDRSAIESNIRRALFLVDRSAFAYYRDLQERGFYNRIISGNTNQTVQIDAVRKDGMNLQYVPEQFKTPELCLQAVMSVPAAGDFVPKRFTEDYNVYEFYHGKLNDSFLLTSRLNFEQVQKIFNGETVIVSGNQPLIVNYDRNTREINLKELNEAPEKKQNAQIERKPQKRKGLRF